MAIVAIILAVNFLIYATIQWKFVCYCHDKLDDGGDDHQGISTHQSSNEISNGPTPTT